MLNTLTYRAEIDLGLTYAMSHPRLARDCFRAALTAAESLGHPGWIANARRLLGIVAR